MIKEQENFLSPDHCNLLIEQANNQLVKTTTLGKNIDGYRVAEGAWLSSGIDFVQSLRQMISSMINIPIENMEGTHVVKYQIGGEYKGHHDFFHPGEGYYENEIKRGGQRTKTALVYLNDDFTGGETEFPNISRMIKPLKGKLVIWDNMNDAGQLNYDSFHAGLPVISGVKYIAVIWIREGRFI